MKIASIVTLAAAVWQTACAADAVVRPSLAPLGAVTAGNPPPPKVLGNMIGGFTIGSGPGLAATYNVQIAAYYNRDLTTGMHTLEFEPGPAKIRADANGVVSAVGIIVMTDPATGAQVTVDLTQLVGVSGPLFASCPAGSPTTCVGFNVAFAGTITLPNGSSYPASGRFRYRWETPTP